MALWGDWVRAAGFAIETLAAGFAASASVFGGGKTARAPQGAAALFIVLSAQEEKTSCRTESGYHVIGGDLAGTGGFSAAGCGSNVAS